MFTEPCYKCVYANFLDVAFSQNGLRDTVIEIPYLIVMQCGLCNCSSK